MPPAIECSIPYQRIRLASYFVTVEEKRRFARMGIPKPACYHLLLGRKPLMGDLPGLRNKKALWAQTSPEGFRSPEKSMHRTFLYSYYPTFLPLFPTQESNAKRWVSLLSISPLSLRPMRLIRKMVLATGNRKALLLVRCPGASSRAV